MMAHNEVENDSELIYRGLINDYVITVATTKYVYNDATSFDLINSSSSG